MVPTARIGSSCTAWWGGGCRTSGSDAKGAGTAARRPGPQRPQVGAGGEAGDVGVSATSGPSAHVVVNRVSPRDGRAAPLAWTGLKRPVETALGTLPHRPTPGGLRRDGLRRRPAAHGGLR